MIGQIILIPPGSTAVKRVMRFNIAARSTPIDGESSKRVEPLCHTSKV